MIDIITDGSISSLRCAERGRPDSGRAFTVFAELGQTAKRSERAAIARLSGQGLRPAHRGPGSVRSAYNCLKRSGITKIGQVLEMSEEDLLAVRNFGQKSLDELNQRLEALGYKRQREARKVRGEGDSEVPRQRRRRH